MAEEIKEETKTDNNKVFGVLSYLGILCLIPLLAKKDDEFVHFHAKQGLVLFIVEIIWFVISSIISGMLLVRFIFGGGMLGLWNIISTLVSLGFIALVIIGIINVVQNQKKELPLIGQFAEKIKF